MKRTALTLIAIVLVAAVGPGIADAAPHQDVDPSGRVVRVWGDNRYETAVAISQGLWTPDNTSTVFLASGTSFPDALAGAASTNGEGPILLTDKDALPAATAGELSRLQPCGIVVLGGPSAVSASVLTAASAYTIACP
jgi:putative cell wall-binding protein